MEQTVKPRRELLERGRRTVFGYLGPMILHETNNVLTVMTGVRQLAKMGRGISDKVGEMIDGQLQKAESLLEWIREAGPQERADTHREPVAVAEAVAALMRLSGKSAGVTARSRSAEGAQIPAADSEPLILAVLCAGLAIVPQKAADGRAQILVATGDAADVPLSVRVGPVTEERWAAISANPDLEVAAQLADEANADLTVERVGDAVEVRAVRAPD